MSGGSDPNKAAMRAQKDQMNRLDAISLPELEQLALESPELAGLLEAEILGRSELENISTDPQLKSMQMDALAGMQERAESGLTVEDKYMMEELLGQAGAQDKSQRADISQEMARRGTGGSGQELAMKLQSQQGAANRGRSNAMEMARQASQGKQSALSNMQQMAGQMESADYGRQVNSASAADRIAAANAQNKQGVSAHNLAARQAIANQKVAMSNQNQMYNKNISQQQFSNELAKAGAQGGVASNMSNISASAGGKPSGLQSGLSGAATGASIGTSIEPGYGTAVGAGIGGLAGLMSAEDGGIASYGDGGSVDHRRPAEVQKDHQADYITSEEKSHNQFKKKYMKRVQDELMKASDEAKKEVTGVVHAEDGDTVCAEDGSVSFTSDGSGDIVGGDSFDRDRVDAKLNSGEAVLNVPQQQRFMDLVRGKIGTDELGDEDIVEGVPREYSEELNEDIMDEDDDNSSANEGQMLEGLKKLLLALGE